MPLGLTAGGIEVLLEAVVLATQPMPLAPHALELAPQSLDFLIFLGECVVRDRRRVSIGRRAWARAWYAG